METCVTHPLKVVVRIYQFPEGNGQESAIQILSHLRVAVRAEGMGNRCREFLLDGVSQAAMENLQAFYRQFVEPCIRDVMASKRCTIIIYGSRSVGKTYTMFGAVEKEGVAFHALSQLMYRVDDGDKSVDNSVEMQAIVFEIYNKTIYDLLATANPAKFE